jgi:Helix-turn-helix domain
VSVRVQTYVWQLNLTPTQKLVAIALADHCHDDGSEARPSQATLVRKTGLSQRAVRNTLHDLVELGVLRLERKSGQHRPNCYYFPIPDGFATLRGAVRAGLDPERQMTTQTGTSFHPEGHEVPPNHKEPSVEPAPTSSEHSVGIVDSRQHARRARDILRGSA